MFETYLNNFCSFYHWTFVALIQDLKQEDLSGREEVYRVMGCSIFSSKAIDFFYKKCQFCYSSGKVAWMDKNSNRSGNALNSKFRIGFLGGKIGLIWSRVKISNYIQPKNISSALRPSWFPLKVTGECLIISHKKCSPKYWCLQLCPLLTTPWKYRLYRTIWNR